MMPLLKSYLEECLLFMELRGRRPPWTRLRFSVDVIPVVKIMAVLAVMVDVWLDTSVPEF